MGTPSAISNSIRNLAVHIFLISCLLKFLSVISVFSVFSVVNSFFPSYPPNRAVAFATGTARVCMMVSNVGRVMTKIR